MNEYKYIELEEKDQVLWLWLNRPDLRNAFNDAMITEIHEIVSGIGQATTVRVLVLAARGNAFCAGADLAWMKKVIDYDYAHNYKESMALAEMLWTLHDLDVPTLALIHGPAVGGGLGLIAACDFALASETAWFKLSEVKLGLAPAVISPFLIEKMGDRTCRELFLTGRKISANQAHTFGLVNEVVPPDRLENTLGSYIAELKTSAPNAIAACKKLLKQVPHSDLSRIKDFTAQMIAQLRSGREGQEGMKAFLEKREPNWDLSTDKSRT
ncbi:enoyl-CoA hydratase/isomerase family protein [bacterium]|nr:enoyl-CoA hydratase/isomerase family protein [bacterium]